LRIDPAHAKARVEAGEAIILDIVSPMACERLDRAIRGAVRIALDELGERWGELPPITMNCYPKSRATAAAQRSNTARSSSEKASSSSLSTSMVPMTLRPARSTTGTMISERVLPKAVR
jgi:hypothetical protein